MKIKENAKSFGILNEKETDLNKMWNCMKNKVIEAIDKKEIKIKE